MSTIFYFGANAFSFSETVPLPHGQFDSLFLKPVLPVTAVTKIHFQQCAQLPIPEGSPYHTQQIDAWNTSRGETRVYAFPPHAPYLMSHYEDNQVSIFAAAEGWKKHASHFQPWHHIHLEQILLENHAVVLHSASIIHQGKAILFTAPSGTGKSTQTDLWHRFAENVVDLNGDRTLLQKTADGWFACGFPIYGSSFRCTQCAVPIGAVVIIRRGTEDRVRELSALEKLSLLYSECTVPLSDARAANQIIDMLEDFIQCTTVVQLECTMNRSAVDVLRNYLYK